MAASTEASAQ